MATVVLRRRSENGPRTLPSRITLGQWIFSDPGEASEFLAAQKY
jgi:hypothetical protein